MNRTTLDEGEVGRIFQAQGVVCTKALKEKRTWHIQGPAGRQTGSRYIEVQDEDGNTTGRSQIMQVCGSS